MSSNDNLGNLTSDVAKATGLPAVAKGKVRRWLLKLVGGTLGAEIVEEARRNLDTTAGRSRVNALLAEEVARRAISDPDIMDRATARFLSDEFRKQENREAIAKATIEELGGSDPEPDSGSPIPDDTATTEQEEDWLNTFSRFAEDASSERMQRLWARVLAGEIRKPCSFSPSTLRFVSELDQQTAEAFKRLAPYVLHDFVVWDEEWRTGEKFTLALELENAGILAGSAGTFHRKYSGLGDRTGIVARDDRYGLAGAAPNHVEVTVQALLLTKVGKELLPLVGPIDIRPGLRKLADLLREGGFVEIWLGDVVRSPSGPLVRHGELLWRAPN